MALTSKIYERIFSKTGSDADLVSTSDFDEMKEDFDNNHYLNDVGQKKVLGPVLYQLQQMQDEIDYLRTEISSNKDKTGISSSQASAIKANTAKVSMVIGTGKGEAMSGQTNLVTVGTQAHQAMAGNTTIPPISITGLPANHTFDVQVRVMPPAKGAKKGTVVLTWAITDVPNRVVYSSNQTLI
tara:strand:+ start:715 stop:1266 length:552 start_codon:yes stop_codon:yes gene_type:complete